MGEGASSRVRMGARYRFSRGLEDEANVYNICAMLPTMSFHPDTESIEMRFLNDDIPFRAFEAFQEDQERMRAQLPTVTRADACKHCLVRLCRSIVAGLRLFGSGITAIAVSSERCAFPTLVVAVALLLLIVGFMLGFVFAHIYPHLH
jgi:hypothetical protein